MVVGKCGYIWSLQRVLCFNYFLFIAPLIDSWPLMGSPAPLLLLFGSYLLFVLNIGPRFMQNRKPFKLTKFIRGYNVFQVIACVYFVEWSINRNVTYKSTWTCIPNKNEPVALMELCKHTWYFLILRIIEFSETVVFVLRKKQNQVSTLHIYHHISTVVLLWLFLKFSPSKYFQDQLKSSDSMFNE